MNLPDGFSFYGVYEDSVTGFSGKATAVTVYSSGAVSIRLEARTENENEKERWISVERLTPAVEARKFFEGFSA